jgi:AGZA family xanthine/uracil permease-like MFS transporter
LPIPVVGDLFAAMAGGHLWPYLSVIVAMGLFNVLGSLQNIESAEAAGDAYPTRRSLTINGFGSIAAALFGSAFPTTIYIGHPGWKALGARAGYSILNGAFVTIICLTGTLAWIAWAIPIDAGMAIVLWIGMMIVAQAFERDAARAHAAVVVGCCPASARGARCSRRTACARPASAARRSVQRRARRRVPEERHVDRRRVRARAGLSLHRDAALGRGGRRDRAPLERRRRVVPLRRRPVGDGLMHSYQWTFADTTLQLAPAWPFVVGYSAMALFLHRAWTTEGRRRALGDLRSRQGSRPRAGAWPWSPRHWARTSALGSRRGGC